MEKHQERTTPKSDGQLSATCVAVAIEKKGVLDTITGGRVEPTVPVWVGLNLAV